MGCFVFARLVNLPTIITSSGVSCIRTFLLIEKFLYAFHVILSVAKSAGFRPIRYVEISEMNNRDKRWLEVRAVIGFSNAKMRVT